MSALADNRVQAIARDIEAYLAAHPDAADSAEGIRRWWLVGTLTEESLGRVCAALDELTATSRITRRVLPDGGVVYAGPGVAPETGRLYSVGDDDIA
ncbi:MAG: hypothetical protein ACREWG_00725 [Gammaproteobacteria bacterium]